MGKSIVVTFEADNQDDLMNDIRQFCGATLAFVEATPEPVEVAPEPPKRKGRKKKKEKEVEVEVEAPPEVPASPGEPDLGLDLSGAGSEELPIPETAELNSTLRELMDSKGMDVVAQVMEEYGGSVKMIKIPQENYPLLWAEAKKALSA